MDLPIHSTAVSVALVGRSIPDNENLGLGYLAAALGNAGIRYRRFMLNTATDVAAVADGIVRGGHAVVGLSIPDGGSAHLPFACTDWGRNGLRPYIAVVAVVGFRQHDDAVDMVRHDHEFVDLHGRVM